MQAQRCASWSCSRALLVCCRRNAYICLLVAASFALEHLSGGVLGRWKLKPPLLPVNMFLSRRSVLSDVAELHIPVRRRIMAELGSFLAHLWTDLQLNLRAKANWIATYLPCLSMNV
ncbi:hypothetical protein HYPSUDRAFT_41110 [Hypholoma sublateritium FD-334 SS-4]|uniref:Uncharacterized protein n=1 Tax=Hypholoma sublateritium (strain FD-334 SS-4) TaxID=945553 RepID=A0A0D2PQW6_HYPSF|nr:hypothetical protein HYPSUDRAFT_41110 [Hypholoma sublateritium FD-334 SS-4]